MKASGARSYVVALLLLVAAYFLTGKLGLSLAQENPSASVVWPPTGIAIAAVLLLGWRIWPAIFVGAFVVNITTTGNSSTSLQIAIGNTLEALVAGWLVNRFARGRHAFERVRDAFAFIFLAAILSTLVSATIGVTSLALLGYADWRNFGNIWTTWWLGDAVGAAVLTPLVIAWSSRSPLRWGPRQVLVIILVFFALLTVSEIIFGRMFPSVSGSYSLPFLAIPILVWIGLRFSLRETASAMFLISIIAVSSAAQGVGPFVGTAPHQSLVALQWFLGVVAVITIVVSAEICERRSAEERLDAQQAIARILGEATSASNAIPRILQAICEKLRWDIGGFWNVKSDTTECVHMWVTPSIGEAAAEFVTLSRRTIFPPGIGLPGRAWQSGRIMWIDDVVLDPNFPRAAAAERIPLCSAFAFPISLRQRVLGVLEFFSLERRQADREQLAMMDAVGSQIGLLIERTEAAAELAQRKAEAETANRAKDNFLAMLSHELRTPLSPILFAVERMEGLGIDHETRELTGIIRRNVEVEARLIDDLLDVTRLGQGKIELRKRSVDAHECMRDAIALCQPMIEERKITVETRLNAADSWVLADPVRLQQIIWNLLQNAVKFSASNGAISVVSEGSSGEGKLQIRVVDHGVGIAPEFLAHVFEPFTQGEEPLRRRFGGLGLGLAISRRLAEMHNGILTATSDGHGHGATFALTLPTVEKPTKAKPPHGMERRKPTEPGRRLRILLVDDHTETREGLERLLQRQGYLVESAVDMTSALRAADSQEFDLLISDLGLPDGSGHEVMERLRGRQSIKGIAISGFGAQDDLDKSKASGFSEHLLKPFEFARLREVIQQLTQ